MMKLEVKEKLINALRSGEYKQGYDELKQNDCFCINGVLCDLAAKDGVGCWDNDYFLINDRRRNIILPFDVARWASDEDLDRDGFAESIMTDKDCLMGKNDSGVSFPVLADIIESAKEVHFHYVEDEV
jgi:hypothetical protein